MAAPPDDGYGQALCGPLVQRTGFCAVSSDSLIGSLAAGRYRVLKLLGEGGMGRVYLAEHEAIQKKLALKVLHLEYSRKDEIVTRFQQEAISASRIKHPNVLEVFDFGRVEDGSFFLAMEFLEGNDLAEELQRKRVLHPSRGLRIALQICRALAAAHAQGVVHRDLKPENVFLQRTADGEEIVKIVDFGIAQLRSGDEAPVSEQKRRRLTKTGMIFGTPEYMAPEQAGGKHADQRTDVYALGVILYEMFTGAVPFTGDSFMAVLTKTLQVPPPPMNEIEPNCAASEELQAVIMNALAKEPTERFQSMAELANALISTPEGAPFRGPTGTLSDIPPGSFMSPFTANPTEAQFQLPQSMGAVTLGSPGVPSVAVSAPGVVEVKSASPKPPAGAQLAAGKSISTQLSALSDAPPAKSGLGVVAAAVAVVLCLGLGAAWFLGSRRDEGISPVAEASASLPLASSAEPSPTPASTPKPPAPRATVAPASGIVLNVETEPAGAQLLKDGFQVCDQTPCEVTATPNEGFELEARLGNKKGTQKVLAQKDQTIQIELKGPPKKKHPAKKQPRLCEVEADGIKILRECP